jgi:hypothetical protein
MEMGKKQLLLETLCLFQQGVRDIAFRSSVTSFIAVKKRSEFPGVLVQNVLYSSVSAFNCIMSSVVYPKSFFDAIRDSIEYIEECRRTDSVSKTDMIDGMENRLSFMLTKVLATPTATSYSVFRLD